MKRVNISGITVEELRARLNGFIDEGCSTQNRMDAVECIKGLSAAQDFLETQLTLITRDKLRDAGVPENVYRVLCEAVDSLDALDGASGSATSIIIELRDKITAVIPKLNMPRWARP